MLGTDRLSSPLEFLLDVFSGRLENGFLFRIETSDDESSENSVSFFFADSDETSELGTVAGSATPAVI
jgi:hypothetical protein